MSLENIKFIVKEIDLLSISYWRELPFDNTLSNSAAYVFTWVELNESEKDYLKENKKYTRIIPVGGLNAAH